ncbi:glycosyltransferase family A protein [Microcoleus sp. D2_18a_D3]|uniref:glycosyltransferase family A protein n=1 Tax=Microcoleus sp. D2_18a_D3 TaxID=3055330 RepID=UPI002FD3CDFC
MPTEAYAHGGLCPLIKRAPHVTLERLYIAPIDADDIWYPQNLEKQVKCLTSSAASVGVVYSWSVDINEKDLLTGGFYNSTIEGYVYTALIYKYFIGNASSSLSAAFVLQKSAVTTANLN